MRGQDKNLISNFVCKANKHTFRLCSYTKALLSLILKLQYIFILFRHNPQETNTHDYFNGSDLQLNSGERCLSDFLTLILRK